MLRTIIHLRMFKRQYSELQSVMEKPMFHFNQIAWMHRYIYFRTHSFHTQEERISVIHMTLGIQRRVVYCCLSLVTLKHSPELPFLTYGITNNRTVANPSRSTRSNLEPESAAWAHSFRTGRVPAACRAGAP